MKVWVVSEVGQVTVSERMAVASARPISWRRGEPPKLLTEPTARWMVRGPSGVSISTAMRAPTAWRLELVPTSLT